MMEEKYKRKQQRITLELEEKINPSCARGQAMTLSVHTLTSRIWGLLGYVFGGAYDTVRGGVQVTAYGAVDFFLIGNEFNSVPHVISSTMAYNSTMFILYEVPL